MQCLKQKALSLCLQFLNIIITSCKHEKRMEQRKGPRSKLFSEESPRYPLLQFSLRRCHSCADVPALLLSFFSCSIIVMADDEIPARSTMKPWHTAHTSLVWCQKMHTSLWHLGNAKWVWNGLVTYECVQHFTVRDMMHVGDDHHCVLWRL